MFLVLCIFIQKITSGCIMTAVILVCIFENVAIDIFVFILIQTLKKGEKQQYSFHTALFILQKVKIPTQMHK